MLRAPDWLTAMFLAALALSVPSVEGADAAKWSAPPRNEAIRVARCLADHIVADHAKHHHDKDHPGVLAVTADLTERPFRYQYGDGDPSESIAEIKRQHLSESCRPESADVVGKGDSIQVATTGHWADVHAATVKVDCKISAIFQRRSDILAHYFCNPVEHRPPDDTDRFWCRKLLEPFGYTALFRKRGMSLDLIGASQSESADLSSHCIREDDPR